MIRSLTSRRQGPSLAAFALSILVLLGIGAPARAQDAAELVVRVNRLEGQLRQLSGQIEQLQYQNQKLQEQFRKYQEDVEYRFQELKPSARPTAAGAQPSTTPSAARPAGPAPAPGQPQKRSDVFDPASQPTAPGAPRTLGTMPADGPVAGLPPRNGSTVGPQAGVPLATGVPMDGIFEDEDESASGPLDLSRQRTVGGMSAPGLPPQNFPPGLPPSSLPQGALPSGGLSGSGGLSTPGAPLVLGQRPGAPVVGGPAATQIAVPGAGSAKDDYDVAYSLFAQKQYDQAEMAFRQYLQTWPRHNMVPNAVYWLGETYYRRGRYPDAVEQYLKIYKTYGSARIAPDSLFKLALSLRGMGQPEQSCATLAEVTRKYPDASADLRAGVDREQKRGNC